MPISATLFTAASAGALFKKNVDGALNPEATEDRSFRLIHNASRNRFIVDFYDVIAMVFHYHYQWNKTNEQERNAIALQEHLAYIAALRSGDLAAVDAACRTHLKSARATLLSSIGTMDAASGASSLRL